MTDTEALQLLRGAIPGDRVYFTGERMPYTVQARSERFVVCTKPFAPRRTVLYCIADLVELVRGPENLIFGFGAETPEQCARMVQRLEGSPDAFPENAGRDPALHFRSEITHRNRVPLDVARVRLVGARA